MKISSYECTNVPYVRYLAKKGIPIILSTGACTLSEVERAVNIIEGEGNKSGMAGAMMFENELGIRFNSNIKGSRDFLKEIWKDKNQLIGEQATVKYFNLTPENKVPRFPYVIAIRNYD